ncbi:NUDIX hydrolase [Motiliproteus sp. MSK22-1]|uniref:NUDIX hydrolase n=1 Tax=Motiliproteus sp. MSK22-1 TaxID=1897630 RepID=UPI0009755D05|nr:NUDIX hydrolase [Motiliproteus sp. MSK22-1]OMH32830.1 NUDIX hydrolase [Motiliproteus sp. MSK22-1]
MCWTPHATVACIIEDNGRFLFVEEYSNGRLVLNQPAGHLEANESFIEGAKREVLEETAWEVEITDLLGMYVYTPPHKEVTYHRTCFVAHPVREQKDRPLDSDIVRAIWLTYEEVKAEEERLRSPLVLRGIEDYLQGRRYPLDFIYEQKLS